VLVVTSKIRGDALEAADRDGLFFDTPTTAGRFARTVTSAA
jgi:hypothetical protein